MTAPDGRRLIVQDAEEELAVMGAAQAAPERVVDEKAALIAEAERRGIVIDKRWGIERIGLALAPTEE